MFQMMSAFIKHYYLAGGVLDWKYVGTHTQLLALMIFPSNGADRYTACFTSLGNSSQ